MKTRWITLVAFVMLFALGCHERERSITSAYGSELLHGEVVLTGDLTGADPSGIEVRARGLGIADLTDNQGQFALFGVPREGVELVFSRESDGIHAVYTVNGPAVLSLALTRTSVSFRRRGSSRGIGHPGLEIEGTIQSKTDQTIVVKTGNGEEHEVLINEDTIIRHGNRQMTMDELEIGMQVHVKAREDGDNKIALEVKVQEEEDDDDGEDDSKLEIEGIVDEVGEDFLKILSSHGELVEVKVTDETIIRHGNTPYTLDQIKVGDRVHAKVEESEGVLTAIEIFLQNPEEDDQRQVTVMGTVIALGVNQVTISTNSGAMVVKADSNTVVKRQGKEFNFAAIAIGDRIKATGTKLDATTILASKVDVLSGN